MHLWIFFISPKTREKNIYFYIWVLLGASGQNWDLDQGYDCLKCAKNTHTQIILSYLVTITKTSLLETRSPRGIW